MDRCQEMIVTTLCLTFIAQERRIHNDTIKSTLQADCSWHQFDSSSKHSEILLSSFSGCLKSYGTKSSLNTANLSSNSKSVSFGLFGYLSRSFYTDIQPDVIELLWKDKYTRGGCVVECKHLEPRLQQFCSRLWLHPAIARRELLLFGRCTRTGYLANFL